MATDGYVDRWNSVAYAAADERRMASVDQMPGASALAFSARSGRRVNGAGLALSVSSTGNGSVSVTPGAGRIFDANYASQGGWDYELPSPIGPLALGARPSTGQSRIDLVVARIYDQDIAVGAVRELKITVIPGTPGASPSAPALPALSHLLGTLTVPASGTISVSQSTAVTVSAGGVLPVSTTADRDALVPAGIAYPGLIVFNAQTKKHESYDGSAWAPLASGDTDWTALPLESGFVTNGTVAPAVRMLGGVVYFRGQVKPSTGNFPTTASTRVISLNGIPAALRPAADQVLVIAGTSTSTPVIRATVGANGAVAVISGSDAQAYVSLAPMSYPI